MPHFQKMNHNTNVLNVKDQYINKAIVVINANI